MVAAVDVFESEPILQGQYKAGKLHLYTPLKHAEQDNHGKFFSSKRLDNVVNFVLRVLQRTS
jgi:hypothetical protein